MTNALRKDAEFARQAVGVRDPQIENAPATPAANDNQCPVRRVWSDSALPSDARAIIEPVERSVNQSGPARAGRWRLRFLPRGRLHVDPLTGWTGSSDTLRHVELFFPSRDAAIDYARRQGLAFDVREPPAVRPAAARLPGGASEVSVRLCCWPTGPHALCCGRYPVAFSEGDQPHGREDDKSIRATCEGRLDR